MKGELLLREAVNMGTQAEDRGAQRRTAELVLATGAQIATPGPISVRILQLITRHLERFFTWSEDRLY